MKFYGINLKRTKGPIEVEADGYLHAREALEFEFEDSYLVYREDDVMPEVKKSTRRRKQKEEVFTEPEIPEETLEEPITTEVEELPEIEEESEIETDDETEIEKGEEL